MKEFNNTKIIGIDHGYENMKTANFCFLTGINLVADIGNGSGIR